MFFEEINWPLEFVISMIEVNLSSLELLKSSPFEEVPTFDESDESELSRKLLKFFQLGFVIPVIWIFMVLWIIWCLVRGPSSKSAYELDVDAFCKSQEKISIICYQYLSWCLGMILCYSLIITCLIIATWE